MGVREAGCSTLHIKPIGTVRRLSGITSLLAVEPDYGDGLGGIEPGDRMRLLYWMDELAADARRAV